MNIGIAQAIEEDLEDIRAILEHGIRSKMYRGDLAWGESVTDESQLKAIINGGNMYVAYTEEEIVAIFMLFWDDPSRWGQQPPIAGYLHRLVVAPGLRGQHVGSQIIDLICLEVAKMVDSSCALPPQPIMKTESVSPKNGFTRADAKANPRISPNLPHFSSAPHPVIPRHSIQLAQQRIISLISSATSVSGSAQSNPWQLGVY
ncbi:GNAT family N-acetyltransferase [Candidatus Saccharibacteria bacterium]|nr:MAG: GNAT family N-acetyltransferase [Candidatus Saccharibacteria bacterium]